jgi:hypothetical protein
VDSFMTRLLYSPGKNTDINWIRDFVSLKGRFYGVEKKEASILARIQIPNL